MNVKNIIDMDSGAHLPLESKEQYIARREYARNERANERSFSIADINVRTCNAIMSYWMNDCISTFAHCELCDCNGLGCDCCNQGVVTYFFNSGFTEPNVIGIYERNLNDK